MAEKRDSKRERSNVVRVEKINRETLPDELNARLRVIWSKLGHLIDWCDDDTSWIKAFCSELLPYRQTFYWEAVAKMVSDYLTDQPTASAEDVLADCLVATQCSPTSAEPDRLDHFRTAWQQILDRSREQIEAFIKSDLELAIQDGTYETVGALYAANYQRWAAEENEASAADKSDTSAQ
jgi:hypothetical protein